MWIYVVFWFFYSFINGAPPSVKGLFLHMVAYLLVLVSLIVFFVVFPFVFLVVMFPVGFHYVCLVISICCGTSSLSDCVWLSSVCSDSWSCCESSLYDFVSSSVSCGSIFVCPYSMKLCSSCSVIIVLGCGSYRIRKHLPNWYKCLGKCFFSLMPWYTLVPVVKCLLWNLVPG